MDVFLVEDSALIRDRLTEMIGSVEGVEVVGHAEDAVESARIIGDLRPDVVILDIRLRGGASGLEVLRGIKTTESPPVAIMLTNFPYPQHRKKAERIGAEYFLDKSSEFDQIPGILRQILARDENNGRADRRGQEGGNGNSLRCSEQSSTF